jgi:hypothetical protein
MLTVTVAYPKDPLAVAVDDLRSLRPSFTLIDGVDAYDPDGRLG